LLNKVSLTNGGQVQLTSDQFNFDMHKNAYPWRNFMTIVQHYAAEAGYHGTNFPTVFIRSAQKRQ